VAIIFPASLLISPSLLKQAREEFLVKLFRRDVDVVWPLRDCWDREIVRSLDNNCTQCRQYNFRQEEECLSSNLEELNLSKEG